MNNLAIGLLACPNCTGKLKVEAAREGVALHEGMLECERCRQRYFIEDGVPRLVGRENLAASPSRSFGFQWGCWLAGGFDRDTIYGISAEREIREFLAYTGYGLQNLKGKVILDAGCGSGRLTKFLGEQGAVVVGMDVHSALPEVQRYCSNASNVTIIQGDILKPPLHASVFDLVWSEGVIHHTGDASKAFDCLATLVKPGGRLFVWVYWNRENNLYRKTRNVLRWGYRLPMPLLFALCYFLAFVFWMSAVV